MSLVYEKFIMFLSIQLKSKSIDIIENEDDYLEIKDFYCQGDYIGSVLASITLGILVSHSSYEKIIIL